MLEPSTTRYEVKSDASSATGLGFVSTNQAPRGPVIGIDLGTSNCSCAIVEDGIPSVVDLRDEETTELTRALPSIVSFGEGGRALVGFEAVRRAADNPQGTIVGAKRFVGRAYDSVAVQKMLRRFPYKVVPGRDGRVGVSVGGRTYTLTNVSGRLLKRIKDSVQFRLRAAVERAIITVPAYYNDNQRDAVVQAGRLAGLTVERILSEPTAAAIAFGISTHHPKTVLVYDLGGGTFDVSVMRMGNGNMRVLACSGDTFLGGNDLDAAIALLACERFRSETNRRIRSGGLAAWLLGQAAESAKRRLSLRDSTRLVARGVPFADGEQGTLAVDISRADLDEAARPLVLRSLGICRSALAFANLRRKDVDEVLLVGGQTRMPLVRAMVDGFFECPVRHDVNPDEAVALGAGILGALPEEVAARLRDVLPMSIGLAHGGALQVVLPRNSPLPCDRRVNLRVPSGEHATRVFEVWQGDHRECYRNELLGKVPVAALQPSSSPVQNVCLHFRMSADGRLSVEISDRDTKECVPVLFRAAEA